MSSQTWQEVTGAVLCALMKRLGKNELDLGEIPIATPRGKAVVLDTRDGKLTVRVMDAHEVSAVVADAASSVMTGLESGAARDMRHINLASGPDRRVESGPLQFDDDWPGVFIRGDDALGYAMLLDRAVEVLNEKGECIDAAVVGGFSRLLKSCLV